MKKFAILLSIFVSISASAVSYQLESFNWSHGQDSATFDKELRVYYRFIPMTEKALEQFQKLNRKFNHKCMVKEKNLRNFLGQGSVVIALYDIKDCKKDGKNPNW